MKYLTKPKTSLRQAQSKPEKPLRFIGSGLGLLCIWICLLCITPSALAVNTPGSPLPYLHHKSIWKHGFSVGESNYDYYLIAKELTAGSNDDYEKVKSLYLWICDNIEYDTTHTIRNADAAWDNCKAVCQGYCELLYRMAEAINIDIDLIHGMVKLPDGRQERHSWIGYKDKRGYCLIDPTLGAGIVRNGNFIKSKVPLLWFDVDPLWFIFSHYPDKGQRQMLKPKLKKEIFAKIPFCSPIAEITGISSEYALHQSICNNYQPPYINGEAIGDVEILSVPQNGVMICDSTYIFDIKTEKEYPYQPPLKGGDRNDGFNRNIVVKNGTDETIHTKNKPVTITPTQTGKLTISIRYSKAGFTWDVVLLGYEVLALASVSSSRAVRFRTYTPD